jgi:hypothetical protein
MLPAGSEAGMDEWQAVDEFLMATCRTELETVLCDGCLTGRLGLVLDGIVKIAPVLLEGELAPGGGSDLAYAGILTVEGVSYAFRCRIFVDRTGQRFLTDVAEFRAVGWEARVVISAA